MYKLMIIDDEPEIRNGIKNVIPWNNYQIEICAEASNGKEALSYIRSQCPDILLVDIRMPILDGLELLKILDSENNSSKAIILSSYDEFSYAQKAVSLGVKEYLLKPCRPEQILQAVLNVIDDIEKDRNVEQHMLKLYKHFSESKSILKERFLYKLICNPLDNSVNNKQKIEALHLDIKLQNIHVMVLKCDKMNSNLGGNLKLADLCIQNITQEILHSKISKEIITLNDCVVILGNINQYDYHCHVFPLLQRLQKHLEKHLDISVSIGIGSCAENLTDIYQSYQHALTALSNKFYLGKSSIIRYHPDLEQTPNTFQYPVNEQSQLFTSLCNNTIEEVMHYLEKYFNALNNYNPSKRFFVQCCSSLLIALYQICIEKNLHVGSIFNDEVLTIIKNENYSTQQDIKDEVKKTLQNIYESIHKNQFNNGIINLCTKYIQEHYNEDVNLQKIASIAFISPGYLSQLFKQVMDVNFIDYVHKIRIENSCELLKDLTLKTYEIAPMVGYNNEKYFSRKFKKYMYMTPSEYRKKYCTLSNNVQVHY